MVKTAMTFGGRAGEMLSRTNSVTATFTGLVLVAAAAGVSWLAQYSPTALLPAVALQFLFSYCVSLFAMEGYSDQWQRAGRSIPPGRVSIVALRYMVLSLALLFPLLFVAPWSEAGLATMTTPTMDAVLLLSYVLLVIMAPPALLVVSVSAPSWRDLISVDHWRSKFSGRGDDFILIYVIFIGALFSVSLAGVPIIALAGTSSAEALTVIAAIVAVFAIGFSISLLGRLCGSFAADLPEEGAQPTAPTLHPIVAQLQRGGAGASSTEATAPRKTALVDASARIEELRSRHAGDATALAAAIRELEDKHLPHPAVSQALVTALFAAGRDDDGVALAREAIPFWMRSGSIGAAAAIYDTVLTAGASLDLAREHLGSIADALKGNRRFTMAVRVYGDVLRQDPTDIKAMKGTIAIAQGLAQQKDSAASAVRIYDDLIATCPASPLIDFIKSERAKAIKRAEAS